MIYKLHYWFFASGANVFSILIGVFVETYTDASPSELGTLLMVIPFLSIIFRPVICSIADRKRAHRKYLLICLIVVAISYLPFIIVPFLGEEVYRDHARICWYLFMGLKVIGDVAFGGVISIGDSLAINYAKRIGTTFTVYRVWGTISWMFFGIVIGQVNELECMPKYVAGFMILILASLLDAFCIWLWPKEYFEMSSTDDCSSSSNPDGLDTSAVNEDKVSHEMDKKQEELKKKKKKDNIFTKSLMPKEVVWYQVKQKLLRLLLCGFKKSSSSSLSQINQKDNNPIPEIQVVECFDKVELARREQIKGIEKLKEESREINKTTQLKILIVLFRRDPRIIMYLVYFCFCGATMSALSFFYISLSDICHSQGVCNFSQLAGLLQVSTAFLETLLFIYIAQVMAKTGRVNMAALGMLFNSIKYTFYGTIWTQVSPYYSLVLESLHGLIFGIALTLMVETGHLFAEEVQYIIPELLERGIISIETDTAKLRYSLSATMQAIVSSAFDGVGRGLGALAFGLLLERINYESLWLVIGITSFVLFVIILAINMISTLLGLRLGLDVKAKDEAAKRNQLAQFELISSSVLPIDLQSIASFDSNSSCPVKATAEINLDRV